MNTVIRSSLVLQLFAVGLAGSLYAQTLSNLGGTAPTPGANDISQLSTQGNKTGPDGLNYYTDNYSSQGNGEPGQTFTTGGHRRWRMRSVARASTTIMAVSTMRKTLTAWV